MLTVSQIQTQQKSPTSVEQAKIDDVTMRGRLRNLMSFAQSHLQIHGERRDNQEGKLDRRIISHLQLVFEQLEKDVDGIKWRVEPSQDGYAELEIGSELSSANDWINAVLNE